MEYCAWLWGLLEGAEHEHEPVRAYLMAMDIIHPHPAVAIFYSLL